MHRWVNTWLETPDSLLPFIPRTGPLPLYLGACVWCLRQAHFQGTKHVCSAVSNPSHSLLTINLDSTLAPDSHKLKIVWMRVPRPFAAWVLPRAVLANGMRHSTISISRAGGCLEEHVELGGGSRHRVEVLRGRGQSEVRRCTPTHTDTRHADTPSETHIHTDTQTNRHGSHVMPIFRLRR